MVLGEPTSAPTIQTTAKAFCPAEFINALLEKIHPWHSVCIKAVTPWSVQFTLGSHRANFYASSESDGRIKVLSTWGSGVSMALLVQYADQMNGFAEHINGILEGKIRDDEGKLVEVLLHNKPQDGVCTYVLHGTGNRYFEGNSCEVLSHPNPGGKCQVRVGESITWVDSSMLFKLGQIQVVKECSSRADDPIESYAKTVRSDNDFAWAIFCNLAMMARDAGAPIEKANERSADLMKAWFGADVRKNELWPKLASLHSEQTSTCRNSLPVGHSCGAKKVVEKPDPGKGYRLLSKDSPELVVEGDEFFRWDGKWIASMNWHYDAGKQCCDLFYRRKIEHTTPLADHSPGSRSKVDHSVGANKLVNSVVKKNLITEKWTPKIGDLVRIKKPLVGCWPEDWPCWTSGMDKYDKHVLKIYWIQDRVIIHDDRKFHFDWLEPAEQPQLTPEPPDGWRWLEVGEVIRNGDRCFTNHSGSIDCLTSVGEKFNREAHYPIIRRNKFKVGEKVVHGFGDRQSISVVESILRDDGWVRVVCDEVATAYHVKDLAPYIEETA